MRHFRRSSFSQVAGVRVSRPVHLELERLMEGYLTHILERRLKTPEFIQRIRTLIARETPASTIAEAVQGQ